jgi:hypothetical protein
MSLKSLSLNFEQLENKIALSTLSHAVYHGKTNNIVKHPTNIVEQPIYYRTKINPIHIPTVPSPINSTPPQVPKQIVPFKFVQNVMPDGSIRCQQVNQPVGQPVDNPNQTLKHLGTNVIIIYLNSFTVNGCIQTVKAESYDSDPVVIETKAK